LRRQVPATGNNAKNENANRSGFAGPYPSGHGPQPRIGEATTPTGQCQAEERLVSDNEIGLMRYLREHAPASQTA